MESTFGKRDMPEEQAKFTHIWENISPSQVSKTVKGMASWIDETRTDNARCRTCAHFKQAKTRKSDGELRDGQCLEWKRLLPRERAWPKIKYTQRACRAYKVADNPPEAFIKRTIDGRDRG